MAKHEINTPVRFYDLTADEKRFLRRELINERLQPTTPIQGPAAKSLWVIKKSVRYAERYYYHRELKSYGVQS